MGGFFKSFLVFKKFHHFFSENRILDEHKGKTSFDFEDGKYFFGGK